MISPGDPFRNLANALEPWLDRVVIIGGWAHRLYRLDPRATVLDYEPLMTLDTDIALPIDLPPGGLGIHTRLIEAGFRQKLLGDDRPPATHYHLGDEESGFYAEFLTPLTGNMYDRKGKRKATVESGGVSTQRLRHLEILLRFPWTVSLDGAPAPITLQVANPVSFIAQKILIQKERPREDRAKDILYIHDTIEPVRVSPNWVNRGGVASHRF